MHLVNEETLRKEHQKQSSWKAAGVDGVTKEKYGEQLDENLSDLIGRMKQFSYKPQAVRRAYIPKDNGSTRPLGIPSYEACTGGHGRYPEQSLRAGISG